MNTVIKIKEIKRVYLHTPSQWDALSDEGTPVWIRFHRGILIVRIGSPDGDIWTAYHGKEIFSKVYGDYKSEFISYRELVCLTKNILDLPEKGC